MNRNTGINAGQIIGTMNARQVIGLDIAKHAPQMHTVNMGTGAVVRTIGYLNIAVHLKKCWDPQMGKALLAQLDGDAHQQEISAIVRAAVREHRALID